MRILLAALVLLPTLALADTPDAQQMKNDDCARARKQNKTCVLDMGNETLIGTVGKGEGDRVDILTFGKAESLISIRRDFIVEILKSAEDL
jgi:hypothetical protein